jgi:hypothetical protein
MIPCPRTYATALKSGGTLVIADHSARTGDGIAVGKSLHRIEESALRHEVEAAGFKLVAEADFGITRKTPVTSPPSRHPTSQCMTSWSSLKSRKRGWTENVYGG